PATSERLAAQASSREQRQPPRVQAPPRSAGGAPAHRDASRTRAPAGPGPRVRPTSRDQQAAPRQPPPRAQARDPRRSEADRGRIDREQARMRIESGDRKSTRLNSSHVKTSYAVFCFTWRPPIFTLFPYTTLFRSPPRRIAHPGAGRPRAARPAHVTRPAGRTPPAAPARPGPRSTPVRGGPRPDRPRTGPDADRIR